jgi:DNA modification methylase
MNQTIDLLIIDFDEELLEKLYIDLDDEANIFLRVNNYSQNNVFEVFKKIQKHALHFINIIVVPTSISKINKFYFLLWLSKGENYYFDKDSIREKHIWKDVEWGKREKNYNSKGKDPGNVWLPTIDDGNGTIIKHLTLDESEVFDRIIKSTATKKSIIITSFCHYEYPEFRIQDVEMSKSELVYNFIDLDQRDNTDLNLSKVIFRSSENLDLVNNESIRLVVTSPPYWDLKDYFKEGQIGMESYDKYLQRLHNAFSQIYPKIVQNGVIAVNINYRVKNKKPLMIPADLLEKLLDIGYYYHFSILWHKSSGIPTRNSNIVDRHEYVMIFSKGKALNINQEAFKHICDYKNDDINFGNLWNINRKAGSVGKQFIHPAIYPLELVDRLIEIFTIESDLVFDPFLGSGTTMISALKKGRVCIGYEYNEDFKDLIKDRLMKSGIDISEIEFV